MTASKELDAQLAVLHDAVLLSAEMKWADGMAVIALQTSGGVVRLSVDRATRLECTREFPWGRSVCVNDVRLMALADVTKRLEIEMQSGDVLVICGSSAIVER